MRTLFLISAFGLLALACSSEANGPSEDSSHIVTQVDGARTIDSLSATEGETYCKDAQVWAKSIMSPTEVARLKCNLNGLLSSVVLFASKESEGRAACQKASDECVAAAATNTSTAESKCVDVQAKLESCKGKNVTVSELIACNEEVVRATKAIADPAWCGTVDPKTFAASVPMNGSACAAVKAKCPAYFESSGASPMGGG
jgi:hypothetical protein